MEFYFLWLKQVTVKIWTSKSSVQLQSLVLTTEKHCKGYQAKRVWACDLASCFTFFWTSGFLNRYQLTETLAWTNIARPVGWEGGLERCQHSITNAQFPFGHGTTGFSFGPVKLHASQKIQGLRHEQVSEPAEIDFDNHTMQHNRPALFLTGWRSHQLHPDWKKRHRMWRIKSIKLHHHFMMKAVLKTRCVQKLGSHGDSSPFRCFSCSSLSRFIAAKCAGRST